MRIIKDIFNITYFCNKNILITGATGTIGNILVNFFLTQTNCNKICIFSRDEFKQSIMKAKFITHDNVKRITILYRKYTR